MSQVDGGEFPDTGRQVWLSTLAETKCLGTMGEGVRVGIIWLLPGEAVFERDCGRAEGRALQIAW